MREIKFRGKIMNKFKKIEFDEKCQSCKGTGLYKGMAERDCFAVICSKCEGTGKYHFVHEYEEFTGREEREGIAKVIQCTPGIVGGWWYQIADYSKKPK